MLSKSDPQDISFILDSLELCSASHHRGEPELTVGCLVRSPPPPADPLPGDQVCMVMAVVVGFHCDVTVIICQQSYLLLVFHYPLTLSFQA